MSSEIRINVTIRLDDSASTNALAAKTAFAAWEAFATAIHDLDIATADFQIGPARPGRPRNRKAKPKLVVTDPPTAA